MFQSYKYKPILEWNNGGTLTTIPTQYINTIGIEYDYDMMNMPIIKITTQVTKTLLNNLILNKNNSTFFFGLQKFADKGDNTVQFLSNYVNKTEFFYFIEKDIDYNQDLDYNKENEKKETDDVYATIELGLLSKKLLEDNKIYINQVFRNTNNLNLLLHYMSHMNLVIEPVESNYYSELLIPSMASITQLIKYLNSRWSLYYGSNYRLFFDFDRTYLVSQRGNAIQTKDNTLGNLTIYINIVDPSSMEKAVQGIELNTETKSYHIYIDAPNSNMVLDNYSDKSFNNIVALSTTGDGRTIQVQVDPKAIANTNKSRILRVNNENFNEMYQLKNEVELSSIILRVLKNDIDSSIFTINMQYIIKNYTTYQYLDGKYLLKSKRELFIKEGEAYISNTILTFAKIRT